VTDATTGETPGDVIRPRLTMTLALPKTGLLRASTGDLFLADIGILKVHAAGSRGRTLHRLETGTGSPWYAGERRRACPSTEAAPPDLHNVEAEPMMAIAVGTAHLGFLGRKPRHR